MNSRQTRLHTDNLTFGLSQLNINHRIQAEPPLLSLLFQQQQRIRCFATLSGVNAIDSPGSHDFFGATASGTFVD